MCGPSASSAGRARSGSAPASRWAGASASAARPGWRAWWRRWPSGAARASPRSTRPSSSCTWPPRSRGTPTTSRRRSSAASSPSAGGHAVRVPLPFEPAVVVWVPPATTSTDQSRAALCRVRALRGRGVQRRPYRAPGGGARHRRTSTRCAPPPRTGSTRTSASTTLARLAPRAGGGARGRGLVRLAVRLRPDHRHPVRARRRRRRWPARLPARRPHEDPGHRPGRRRDRALSRHLRPPARFGRRSRGWPGEKVGMDGQAEASDPVAATPAHAVGLAVQPGGDRDQLERHLRPAARHRLARRHDRQAQGGAMSNGSGPAPTICAPRSEEDPVRSAPPPRHRAAAAAPDPSRQGTASPALPPQGGRQRAGPVADEHGFLVAAGLGQLRQPLTERIEQRGRPDWSGPRPPGRRWPAYVRRVRPARSRGSGPRRAGRAGTGRHAKGSGRRGPRRSVQRRRGDGGLDGLDHGRGLPGRRQRPEVERAVGPWRPARS